MSVKATSSVKSAATDLSALWQYARRGDIMLKILVADDEEKVCQLIIRLVDWEALEMEVVGTASNGFDALEKIRDVSPDVVITDIRMPGLDGMELIRQARLLNGELAFVIISGYRHFEYARTAIKYGVSDYLLKPIKKEELTATLSRIKELYLERTQQLTFEERVRLVLKNDAGRLRTNYFSNILYPKRGGTEPLSLEEINREYHYSFCSGVFQIFCIKFDRLPSRDRKSLEFLVDKANGIAQKRLEGVCCDFELYAESSYVFLLLNYLPGNQKTVRHEIKALLDELSVFESIMAGMRVTIGVGEPAESVSDLRCSLRTARWRVEQRLICGNGLVIDSELKAPSGFTDSEQFEGFNRDMEKAVESLDSDEVGRHLQKLEKELLGWPGITGHELLQMCKEVCNVYLLSMKRLKIAVENEDSFVEQFAAGADECESAEVLFRFLNREIGGSFTKAAGRKKQEDNRPIRTAKKYINEHYMNPITLEDVSAMAGFNPTYFSSLFKKETGTPFLEYLSGVRMDMAKRLLKETGQPVAAICEAVGYSDVKYFVKAFVKYTGLKPNEYRKLYS